MTVDVRLLSPAPFRPAELASLIRRLRSRVPAAAVIDSLSLVTVGSARMAALNGRYRKKRTATNVLAFSLSDLTKPGKTIGEILLCMPIIRREARLRALPLRGYTASLIIHGFLHCAGYDHERNAGERRRMERLEDRLLRLLPAHQPR